ncbi:CAP domain-containing protein [Reinekea blandensis]|uniref:SCP domain-containing protein n=1 Tax=Reinekea blandensis MED297 TaxID=314283 RepID=A4B9W5_9GAMM|nr:CAP domain-containing protein [Reinekea blandensis]EAR11416.1 hypothetical protein MED297_21052 [Reinekea sp. MED297] [Reinekea blandensis MED297]
MRSSIPTVVGACLLSACFTESPDSNDPDNNTEACETGEICQTWLDTHNNFRAELNAGTVVDDGTYGTYPIPATPLPTLTWNAQLAQVAQAHADACVYEHNPNREDEYVAAGGENIYIGENIAVNGTTGTLATLETYAEAQTEAWWSEYDLWHYKTYQHGTDSDAGHFTQMIWANTIEIGCGIASCPGILPGYTNAAFGVCNYGPGGNYNGQYPYEVSVLP